VSDRNFELLIIALLLCCWPDFERAQNSAQFWVRGWTPSFCTAWCVAEHWLFDICAAIDCFWRKMI